MNMGELMQDSKNLVTPEIRLNYWKVKYSYKTIRGNEKTKESFIITNDSSNKSAKENLKKAINELNKKHPARTFLSLKILKCQNIGESVLNMKTLLNKQQNKSCCNKGLTIKLRDFLNISSDSNFFCVNSINPKEKVIEDIKKNFLSSEITIPFWRIKYSYETTRKNSRERTCFVIEKDDEISAKCNFLEFISDFNNKHPYRTQSNVQILDCVNMSSQLLIG